MLTPCLGREQTQERLASALAASRWVTIVGPPGSGKTLLARHAAARDASTWVDARGIRRPDDVLSACLDALDARPGPGDSSQGALCRAVDGVDSLLVVDGLDVDPTLLGPAFQQVVSTTTDARLALTSVTMAGQPAERVVRVGPFTVPRAHEPLAGPAVELFLHRVEAAGGHPVDLATHGDDVRRLLHATGGLPLLIEQIAAQIALVGVTNVVPTASLSEAVHASYELLDEEQQRCFRRLAHMTSPVSLEVLAEITGVDRDRAATLAAGLVRRSLVEVMPDGRFDMLTPIRRHGAYLTASTDDREETRRALLRWADRVAPDDLNSGAADAGWLADLPVMRSTITGACDDPDTRPLGYALANRIFSSLYTSMKAHEAVEILEATLVSGDGPAEIGAQVARRAGIAASEVRGTYEGLWLLDRADEHAQSAPDPDGELSKNASIRAEMHLDAGALLRARAEAQRALDLGAAGGEIRRQVQRTLADVHVSLGDFRAAMAVTGEILAGRVSAEERWAVLSARTLMARVALEQGRPTEAASAARAVVADARAVAEDRVALLAEVLLRHLDASYRPADVDRDTLPWAVRIPVLAQDARDLLRSGDLRHAAGLAADVVVLADSSGLGRDAVEARLLLARSLLADGDEDQAASTFLAALDRATTMPMPLRVADALDGLAHIGQRRGLHDSRTLAAAAAALRGPRQAVAWGYAADTPVATGRSVPQGWIAEDGFTPRGVEEAVALFTGASPPDGGVLGRLTTAERHVAERVAVGLTSRQIAEELFLSPRTVDAHLTHIYRKLGISSRARLAALVADRR